MIILLGMPGAGKTTQTKLLAEYLNCPWFSMGELIRQHSTGKDREEMLRGKIIGDEITIQILWDAIKDLDTANDELIIEGNPRTKPQADWWLAKIHDGSFKFTGLIYLTIDAQTAQKRLFGRGREDDGNHEVIKKRFAEYQRTTAPTIQYLKDSGLKTHEINAAGSIEEIFAAIKKALSI